MTVSAACLKAANSGPEEEVSILVCLLESHMYQARTTTQAVLCRESWTA